MEDNFKDIDEQSDTLVLALTLAIMAPDDVTAKEVADMAEVIAEGMTPEQIANCQTRALQMVDQTEDKPYE